MRFFLSLIVLISSFSIAFSQVDYDSAIADFRKEYLEDFLENERSPLKDQEALSYLKFYDADSNFKVTASFEKTPRAKQFSMTTFSGISKPYIQYGWLKFTINGEKHKLAVYQNLKLRVVPQYRDYLFLPFKDFTNGEGSYGGGRYIDIKTSDIKDGKLELDFNKAYNPWCAYSDGFSCPIPPVENHLKVEIPVGEKNYGKSKY